MRQAVKLFRKFSPEEMRALQTIIENNICQYRCGETDFIHFSNSSPADITAALLEDSGGQIGVRKEGSSVVLSLSTDTISNALHLLGCLSEDVIAKGVERFGTEDNYFVYVRHILGKTTCKLLYMLKPRYGCILIYNENEREAGKNAKVNEWIKECIEDDKKAQKTKDKITNARLAKQYVEEETPDVQS